MTLPAYMTDAGRGVYCIDTGYTQPSFAAAYLLVHGGRAAFIDTGHNAAVPRLLGALQALGLATDAVDWVIPTHAHLDHAGGAGLLMTHLPKARLLSHPRAARHLIDPHALINGAQAVYGAEAVAELYGDILPVPAERVQQSSDGQRIELAGRALVLIDTPGHARHHHCVWDETTRGWFTGDAFGISYPLFDGPGGRMAFPSATPVQFEPGVMRQTIERMLTFDPERLYVTHFGPVLQPQDVARQLFEQLAQIQIDARAIAAAHPSGASRHAALCALVEGMLMQRAQQCVPAMDPAQARAWLQSDFDLNAQGIGVWLDKQEIPRA